MEPRVTQETDLLPATHMDILLGFAYIQWGDRIAYCCPTGVGGVYSHEGEILFEIRRLSGV